MYSRCGDANCDAHVQATARPRVRLGPSRLTSRARRRPPSLCRQTTVMRHPRRRTPRRFVGSAAAASRTDAARPPVTCQSHVVAGLAQAPEQLRIRDGTVQVRIGKAISAGSYTVYEVLVDFGRQHWCVICSIGPTTCARHSAGSFSFLRARRCVLRRFSDFDKMHAAVSAAAASVAGHRAKCTRCSCRICGIPHSCRSCPRRCGSARCRLLSSRRGGASSENS